VIGLGRGALSMVLLLPRALYFRFAAVNQSHLFVGASAGRRGGDVAFVKNPKGITVGKAKLDVPAAAFGLRDEVGGPRAR